MPPKPKPKTVKTKPVALKKMWTPDQGILGQWSPDTRERELEAGKWCLYRGAEVRVYRQPLTANRPFVFFPPDDFTAAVPYAALHLAVAVNSHRGTRPSPGNAPELRAHVSTCIAPAAQHIHQHYQVISGYPLGVVLICPANIGKYGDADSESTG